MQEKHPNIDLLQQVDITDLAACAHLFAEDVIWHFFNPRLPAVAGDYRGLDGIADFFARMAEETAGSFRVSPRGAWAVGEELVVAQTCNSLIIERRSIEVDVVLVWRIVGGRITEVWDIPAVDTARLTDGPAP